MLSALHFASLGGGTTLTKVMRTQCSPSVCKYAENTPSEDEVLSLLRSGQRQYCLKGGSFRQSVQLMTRTIVFMVDVPTPDVLTAKDRDRSQHFSSAD